MHKLASRVFLTCVVLGLLPLLCSSRVLPAGQAQHSSNSSSITQRTTTKTHRNSPTTSNSAISNRTHGSKSSSKVPNTGANSSSRSKSSSSNLHKSKSGNSSRSGQQKHGTITCYIGLQPQPGQPLKIAPLVFSRRDYSQCGSFQFMCTKGNEACTLAEQDAQVWKWVYTPMPPHKCISSAYMDKRPAALAKQFGVAWVPSASGSLAVKYPYTRHQFCCSTDGCNQPDRRLDTTTVVVERPAGVPSVVPSAKLSCMVSLRRYGNVARSKVFNKVDGYRFCGRFQHNCSSPQRPLNHTCMPAEVDQGAVVWHYNAFTKAECEHLLKNARKLGYTKPMCCSSDDCNAPTQGAGGNSTVVVKWTGLVSSSPRPGKKTRP